MYLLASGPWQQVTEHGQPLTPLRRRVNVAHRGVGMTRPIQNLLVAPDELSSCRHSPERFIECRVKVADPLVGPYEAVPADEDLVSTDGLLSIVIVGNHLKHQHRVRPDAVLGYVDPHGTVAVQMRRRVAAIAGVDPRELRGIERIQHRHRVHEHDLLVPYYVQQRVDALVVGRPLGINLVLILPKRRLGEVLLQPEFVGRHGYHDRRGVTTLLREVLHPATPGLAEYDHRIRRGQQLLGRLLVHLHRVLRANLVEGRDYRDDRPVVRECRVVPR